MSPGQWISGIGHGGLIAWVLLGGLFRSEPPEVTVTEVSVISSDAFDALISTAPSGQIEVDLAALTAPSEPQAEPEPVESELPPSSPATPDTIAPEPTPVPPDIEEAQPTPRPELVDTAPPVAAPPAPPPAPAPEPEAQPEPPAQLVTSIRPRLRPANLRPERIAPEAAPTPEPEAAPDPSPQEQVAETPEAEAPRETQQAQAPEAAATEQTPEEAEQPEGPQPLTTSLRPRMRPAGLAQRRAPAPEPETEPQTAPETAQGSPNSGTLPADVNNALADALGGDEAADAASSGPSGPPLTGGEESAFLNEIRGCWNLAPLSSEALSTTVVLAWDMQRDGRPVANSIRMIGSSGGSAEAARQAFEAARRAVQRCGASGYDLPPEKYNRWDQVEVTFNPENMSFR